MADHGDSWFEIVTVIAGANAVVGAIAWYHDWSYLWNDDDGR